jgi:hypothetical protein
MYIALDLRNNGQVTASYLEGCTFKSWMDRPVIVYINCFNIKKPLHSAYKFSIFVVFRMIFTINKDYFLKDHLTAWFL